VAEGLVDATRVDLIDTKPKEWEPIVGDHVLTPLRGIVRGVSFPHGDNPFTHEFRFDCPPSLIASVAKWTKDEEPNFCTSDIHIGVRPLAGFAGLVGEGEGSKETDNVTMEYERGHARAFTAMGGDPRVGDLVFAAGRWVVDCGHDYKTEIHPPSVVSYMRSTTVNGDPATLAYVWVNGFYPGDPVDLVIHAPPRPSPDHVLTINKQVVTDADVTVEDGIVANQYFRLRFSASHRLVKVSDMGEMKYQTGRDFKARYLVSWTR
jgi:hypothetical protein